MSLCTAQELVQLGSYGLVLDTVQSLKSDHAGCESLCDQVGMICITLDTQQASAHPLHLLPEWMCTSCEGELA